MTTGLGANPDKQEQGGLVSVQYSTHDEYLALGVRQAPKTAAHPESVLSLKHVER